MCFILKLHAFAPSTENKKSRNNDQPNQKEPFYHPDLILSFKIFFY